MLVGLQVVARNCGVHRTFEKETQHRVVGVIRLVKGEYSGAVRLFLEFVVALCAGPEASPDRHITRQFVLLRLGPGLPGPPLSARQQILGDSEHARAYQTLAGVVAFVEDLHTARWPFEDPRAGRVRRYRR